MDLKLKVKCAGLFSLRSNQVLVLALVLGQKLRERRYGLSASGDQTVKVWDLSSGQELRTLSGHTSYVRGVAISSDGRYGLSASDDKTVKVWDLSSGQEVASFTGNGDLTCCAIAPDGVTFVVGDSGGQIHFLRLEGVASGTGV